MPAVFTFATAKHKFSRSALRETALFNPRFLGIYTRTSKTSTQQPEISTPKPISTAGIGKHCPLGAGIRLRLTYGGRARTAVGRWGGGFL